MGNNDLEHKVRRVLRDRSHGHVSIERLVGYSGNPVFIAKDHSCVVKVFKRVEDRDREQQGYHFLSENKFNTVSVLQVIDDGGYYYLMLSVAPGLSLGDFALHTRNPYILTTIGYNFGRTLRQLHDIRRRRVYDEINQQSLRHRIHRYHLDNRITKAFINNPGEFTYVHGDPSPDNFFVESVGDVFQSKYNIIVLDPSAIIRNTMNNYSTPAGFPACDYHRALFTLRLFSSTAPSDMSNLETGFIEGYYTTHLGFTTEADVLFDRYWNSILQKKLRRL